MDRISAAAVCLGLALAIFVGAVIYAHAGDVWIEGQYNRLIYSDNNIDHTGQQYKALLGWKALYLWGALEDENSVDWGGQDGPLYTLSSVGAGLRVPMFKHLSAYVEGGYFFLKDQQNKPFRVASGSEWESIHIFMVDQLNGQHPPGHPAIGNNWDTYRTNLENAWGGQIGVVFSYPLIWGIEATANSGYRYLKAERHTEGRLDPSRGYPADYVWLFDTQQDLSAWVMGVGFKYEF